MLNNAILIALACGAIALVYGGLTAAWILRQPDGNDRMREIAAAIQTGAKAYLNRQYTTIGIVGAVIFLVLGFVPGLGWTTAAGFLIGAVALLAMGLGLYPSQPRPTDEVEPATRLAKKTRPVTPVVTPKREAAEPKKSAPAADQYDSLRKAWGS